MQVEKKKDTNKWCLNCTELCHYENNAAYEISFMSISFILCKYCLDDLKEQIQDVTSIFRDNNVNI